MRCVCERVKGVSVCVCVCPPGSALVTGTAAAGAAALATAPLPQPAAGGSGQRRGVGRPLTAGLRREKRGGRRGLPCPARPCSTQPCPAQPGRALPAPIAQSSALRGLNAAPKLGLPQNGRWACRGAASAFPAFFNWVST